MAGPHDLWWPWHPSFQSGAPGLLQSAWLQAPWSGISRGPALLKPPPPGCPQPSCIWLGTSVRLGGLVTKGRPQWKSCPTAPAWKLVSPSCTLSPALGAVSFLLCHVVLLVCCPRSRRGVGVTSALLSVKRTPWQMDGASGMSRSGKGSWGCHLSSW